MEENPYRAPVGGSSYQKAERTKMLLALAAGAVIGIMLATALAVAAVIAIQRIDVRENPVYWDEIDRRQKMGMNREEAARSIEEERGAPASNNPA